MIERINKNESTPSFFKFLFNKVITLEATRNFGKFSTSTNLKNEVQNSIFEIKILKCQKGTTELVEKI